MARSHRHNVIAICLIFEAGCSPCGATAAGGSWEGSIDGEDTCGVLLLFVFFGAAGDAARSFFGFRPRLLGMGKRQSPWMSYELSHDLGMIQKPSNS